MTGSFKADDTNRVMRSMAWERAKGELRAMKHTFYGEDGGQKFLDFCAAIEGFIKDVENRGLHE